MPTMQSHVRRGVSCVVLLFLAGGFAHVDRVRAGDPTQEITPWSTAYKSYVGQQSTEIAATIRTFPTTHPDFTGVGAGTDGARYSGITGDYLGPDGKPIFASTGRKILTEWKDAAGRPIIRPRSYIASRPGDTAGSLDTAAGAAVTSAASFNQWFRNTPGVNTSSAASLNLQRQGSSFIFDGSLDNITGARKTAYTAEAEWHFVHQANRDFFIDVASNAEVWLFIDDRLVIDGGAMAGVKFTISGGTVVTQEACDAHITVLGAAIQSGSTPCPVTLRSKTGTTTQQPFGSFSSFTAGNVNDNKNPRTARVGTNLPSGTVISVTGQSWIPSGSSFKSHLTIDSSSTSQAVKVYRNGDLGPNIAPFQNQASAASFLAPYINAATKRIVLQPNQAIYLFELGTTNLTSAAADFQDLVVLVSLSRPNSTPTATTTTSTAAPAPEMRQRIDLSRLTWLEDNSSHKIKLLFANRTGNSSSLRVETNISTLNLANFRASAERD